MPQYEGAIKFGNTWAIPEDTEKPKDERIKSGKYIKTPNASEIISNFTPSSAQSQSFYSFSFNKSFSQDKKSAIIGGGFYHIPKQRLFMIQIRQKG